MDIRSLGKSPISAQAPAGEDAIYSPEFEALQSEIDKLSIVTTEAGEVDWNKVLDLAATLLAEKTKNLLVAAYMAEALIQTRQFEGFVQGSTVIKDMVENYWDTCYPPKKRKKGRLNALHWWYDRAGKFLAAFDASPLPQESVDDVRETITSLDSLLGEKIADAPILRPLIQHLDRLPVESVQSETAPAGSDADPGDTAAGTAGPEPVEPEPVAKQSEPGKETGSDEDSPTPASQKPAPEKPTAAPALQPQNQPAASRDPESGKDAGKLLNGALDTMAKLATYYLKTDPANPLAYRLNRMYAWFTINSLPMVQEERKTPLPPPDAVIKNSIEKQLTDAQYVDAVVLAESHLRSHLFWLDLNRLAAQGLEAMGDKFSDAHDMVCRETGLFVKQLPEIGTLTFSDGTPFADSETRAWLKSISAAEGQQGPPAAPAADTESATRSRQQEIEAEARQMVKKKNIVEAVTLFQENLACCASGREKLLIRMGLCRMLLDMGKTELALPHLETLDVIIDHHELESWEPDLAVQGLCLVYDGFKRCSREAFNNKADGVFDRIARINPATAYTLGNA